jgi:hypothetical protein
MTASLTLLRLVGPKALPRVDLVGSDVQPGQIKKVLSYLTNRDAYSPDLIELSVLSAFMAVRGAKLVQRVSKKIPTAKMVRERLRKAERVLRMIEQVKGDLDGNLFLPTLSVQEIRGQRQEIERCAGALAVSRTGGKRNLGREAAVTQAYHLLTDFSTRPGCTRGGPWHEVANILHATDDDLFPTMRKLQKSLSSEVFAVFGPRTTASSARTEKK